MNKMALKEACSREDMIRKTADQIIKDFAEFGFDIHFSGNVENFYQELYGQMKQHLLTILSEHYTRLLGFLYRIDITEEQVSKYQTEMDDAPYEDALTELIIHRELKKVMIREYLKAQPASNQSDSNLLDS